MVGWDVGIAPVLIPTFEGRRETEERNSQWLQNEMDHADCLLGCSRHHIVLGQQFNSTRERGTAAVGII